MALNAQHMKPVEFVRNVFGVTAPAGSKFEDVLKTDFWTHVAARFHPTDRIEVMADDGSWFAELIVISCARNWAKVSTLRFVELSESTPDEAPAGEFEVKWRGQANGHCVVRLSDKEVIKSNFPTAKEAKVWLAEHEANMKA